MAAVAIGIITASVVLGTPILLCFCFQKSEFLLFLSAH